MKAKNYIFRVLLFILLTIEWNIILAIEWRHPLSYQKIDRRFILTVFIILFNLTSRSVRSTLSYVYSILFFTSRVLIIFLFLFFINNAFSSTVFVSFRICRLQYPSRIVSTVLGRILARKCLAFTYHRFCFSNQQ